MNVEPTKKKISFLGINRIMIAVSVVLAIFTIAEVIVNSVRYRQMEQVSGKNMEYFAAVDSLNDASDYLTDQARNFINLKDKKYLDLYVKEVEEEKRREKSIEFLEEEMAESQLTAHLNEAKRYSDDLAEIELYAMRLLIDGMGYDIEEFPDIIKNVELKNADKELASYEKLTVAWKKVTNTEYETYKAKIRNTVQTCTQMIYSDATADQLAMGRLMLTSIRLQEILIIILISLTLLTAFLSWLLILSPLRRNLENIKDEVLLDTKGSREMQIFAIAYNRIFEKNVKKSARLSYEANHDALTDLLNRTAFDKDMEEEEWDSVALLIVDIDGFKKINDTYLHTTGDFVLKRVANVLKSSFRSDDRVYRIGGDEFAVVMVGAKPEHEGLVRQKYASVRKKIEADKNNFYGATLSVGVAYGDWKRDSEEIFKRADATLYTVKKSGKNAIAFSPEVPEGGENE
ncbi:MAG: GGDEF domain-containing protein [Clostridia bacterium]|nr:GGDEF domain-containing protein [Clostridia bacterium]